MYSINTLNNNFDDQNDQNRPISSINSSVLRSSLSDSDLITSVAVVANNNDESNHENIVSTAPPATKSLSRDFELLIIDENLAVNSDDSKSADQSNNNDKTKQKHPRKSRKSMFLLKRKRRKWISTQIGFITKCFMTRTDSIIDLPTTIDSQNNRLQLQSQPQLSSDGCQSTAPNSSDHEDQQQQPSADSNSNENDDHIADGDAHRINIDDDLSFMDNFPPLNQPLSRIVSLRRRHPNTPMSRSPEPALLAPNPYPVVLTGFANTYLNHPQIPINDSQSNQQHQQQDHNIPSISSVVVNADPNSGTSTPSGHHNHHPDNESNDDHQRSPQQQQQQRQTYESYSLQMPIINHISIDHPMNRSTSSSSTLTFHTQIDYINCLVPDLLAITNRSFYWGKMDRYKAERLLDGKPEGTFLLRDSAQEDHLFSVSFRRFERSLHARIENWEHRFSFDSHDPGVFSSPTVTGLIEHYKVPSHCMFFEPVLTKPLNRTFTFSLQHLARATICDRVTYDSINRLPLPQILKSYLKEYHYRIKVRTRHFDESSLCRWLESNYHRNNHVSIFDNDESI